MTYCNCPVEWEGMTKEAAKLDWRKAAKPGSASVPTGENLTLKGITDMLLKGKISAKKAEELTNKIKSNAN